MLKLSDIKHESENHFIVEKNDSYEIYRIGCTHAVRCAQIGFAGDKGLHRAIQEVSRREIQEAGIGEKYVLRSMLVA